VTSDMRARLAGADDERCAAISHCGNEVCGACKHEGDQAHIAYDDSGTPVLQWNETDDGQPEPRE
jgi:hypothetical protein